MKKHLISFVVFARLCKFFEFICKEMVHPTFESDLNTTGFDCSKKNREKNIDFF